MEIIFLWIENYLNIIRTGFNFSSEYNIEYDHKLKELWIRDKDSEPVQIFNEAFLNINAIIGKNGSGKTNILSFIKTIFSHGVFNIGNNYILIIKNNKDELLIVDKVLPRDEYIKISPDFIRYRFLKDNIDIVDNVSLVYYSNSYSIYEDIDLHRRYYDCSLNTLIYKQSIESNNHVIKSYERAVVNHESNKDKESEKSKEDKERNRDLIINRILPKSFIFTKEILSQIQFISKYFYSGYDFIPKYFDVSINAMFINETEKDVLKSISKLDTIISILNKSKTIDENNQDRFKDKLILALFLFIWKHQLFEETRNLSKEAINEKINDVDESDLSKVILDYIMLAEPHPDDYNLFPKILKFLNILDEQLNQIQFYEHGYSNTFQLALTENLLNLLSHLFEFWYDNNFIFHFNWYGMSAGESALLTIFSRIYDVSRINRINDTVWLLIDEGELYLHPEWQRNFINDLHTYIPRFFIDRKIHVILTSHSPFIASDLPKDNIIQLIKSENGICKIVDQNNHSETFGANIHELLKDSFFLQKGSIGELSRIIIDDLFNYLSRNESKYNLDKEKSKKLIEIIGEPIVKFELIRLFDRKYNENNELIYLQSESDRINRRINDIKDNDRNSYSE